MLFKIGDASRVAANRVPWWLVPATWTISAAVVVAAGL